MAQDKEQVSSVFNNSLFFPFVDSFCFSEAEAAETSPVAVGQACG